MPAQGILCEFEQAFNSPPTLSKPRHNQSHRAENEDEGGKLDNSKMRKRML